ncbi:MAG TPA: agmatine deiminase family protein, partial [Agromyces mariniharenae]|nr:agmatine deiminase family protein [Agromyces mariniharenae]
MTWRMPAETAPHERTWMAFPREGITLGESTSDREEGYAAWTAVAHAVAEFEPVTMLVDPTERERAASMLVAGIEQVEAPVDEFWMRDHGPTFVVDDERPGVLGAVDWVFNGWGAPAWSEWRKSAEHARLIADLVGAETVSSLLVNEGGGIHVDGEGTVLVTETVQLDPRRNPYA